MGKSTTVAVSTDTHLKLIRIKSDLDVKKGNIHSLNEIIQILIQNYQQGDGMHHATIS